MSGRNKALVFMITAQLFLHSAVQSQSNGDFRSILSGNWNNSSVWEQYNSGVWTPANSSPNQLSGQITVRHNLSVNSDQAMDQVLVDTGASINIQAGVTVTITNSQDAIELNVKGTIVNSGMLFFSPSAIMKIDSGGTYVHNSSVASTAVLDATQLHEASNWIYRGNGSLSPPVSISSRHYGNLIFESSAGNWSRTITGSGSASCTSLRIDPNIIIINNYIGILSILGSLTLNGTLVNGAGSQKILLAGTDGKLSGINLNNFFDQMTIPSPGHYLLQNDMQLSPSASFTVYGVLNCNTFSVNGNNNGSTFNLIQNAWIITAHPVGIIGSVMNFSNMNFSNDANYEFTGSTGQEVKFYNSQIKNLNINGDSSSVLTLKNNVLSISGTLTVLEGVFNLDSCTVIFSGQKISGKAENIQSTEFSSLQFTGEADSIFIPVSIDRLNNLTINKSMHNVALLTNLSIKSNLNLQNGILKAGVNEVLAEGNILGGSDSSFVAGPLVRNVFPGSSQNITFPVGGNYYQPLSLQELDCASDSRIRVQALEIIPSGTSDGVSLEGAMYNRHYQLKVIGNMGITSLRKITAKPAMIIPALSSNSKLGFSTDNLMNSYHGIGGIINSDSISSMQGLSVCQINELSSSDGAYIGIADEYSVGGTYTDSTCNINLSIKVYIQGFYLGNGTMIAVIDPIQFPSLCDTINIEFHSSLPPYETQYSFMTCINTTGIASLEMAAIPAGEYFIVLKHRNSLETWSSTAAIFSDTITYYDFSLPGKSLGNNMIEMEPGIYGVYSGDLMHSDTTNQILQDGKIDLLDLVSIEDAMLQFSVGYIKSDLNGDGITDLSDYSLIENNVQRNLEVIRPY